ncbi:MAG: hypothetical protein V9G20_19380 [Candidatus Promineifilaceae bacterium]
MRDCRIDDRLVGGGSPEDAGKQQDADVAHLEQGGEDRLVVGERRAIAVAASAQGDRHRRRRFQTGAQGGGAASRQRQVDEGRSRVDDADHLGRRAGLWNEVGKALLGDEVCPIQGTN